MTEPNNQQTPPAATPPQGNDAAELGKQIATLTQQLTAAQTQIKTLEGQTGGLTSSNNQLTEQLTKLQGDLLTASKALEAKTTEFTTVQTQLQQAQTQLTDLAGKNTQLTKQVDLFNLIADTPDYHGLVGSFKALSQVIKPDATAETVEGLLKALAGDAQAKVAQALDILKGGGSPPSNHGGTPPPAGPKNKEEAWAVLQATPITNQAEYAKAMNQFMAFVAGDNTQKPA